MNQKLQNSSSMILEHNVNPMKVDSEIESLAESDQMIVFATADCYNHRCVNFSCKRFIHQEKN